MIIIYTHLFLPGIPKTDLPCLQPEYKKAITNSSNTIKRYIQYYAKYFEPSKLHHMKFPSIDTFLLEMECNHIVKEFSLTRKAWVNAKTILNGMFDYAKRKNYISDNPLSDVKITVRYKQVVKKQGLPKHITLTNWRL